MRSFYQLFDLVSGNVIADFAQEHEAWDALRRIAINHGVAELHGLGLMYMQDDEVSVVAMDEELVRRVIGDGNSPALSESGRIETVESTSR